MAAAQAAAKDGKGGRAPLALKPPDPDAPELAFELPYGPATQNLYALVAKRHMHEFGTTSEQLAWIKVAASHHAQHNPNAMLRDVVTVNDVVNSPLVSDPLHRLDCCVMSDGGGALVLGGVVILAVEQRHKRRYGERDLQGIERVTCGRWAAAGAPNPRPGRRDWPRQTSAPRPRGWRRP